MELGEEKELDGFKAMEKLLVEVEELLAEIDEEIKNQKEEKPD